MRVSVPLRGVGCFRKRSTYTGSTEFPSPCGVWVVSPSQVERLHHQSFRPLAGCGLFPSRVLCSRWVIVSVPLRGVGCFLCMSRSATCGTVSVPLRGVGCFGMKCPTMKNASRSFRPLAGCGLFRQSCTFFLVQQEKELSTLLFYCIILADVYQ